MTHKTGASAKNLQHTMGFRRWRPHGLGFINLSVYNDSSWSGSAKGTVEVDETFIGGKEEGVKGRKTTTKALVVIARRS